MSVSVCVRMCVHEKEEQQKITDYPQARLEYLFAAN